MSRSGYSDDYDQWSTIKWRGQVASAFRGRRGQAFLIEALAALDAMPVKRLITDELEQPLTGLPFAPKGGEFCLLGAVGRARGYDMSKLDPHESEQIGEAFGIAHQMAAEIVYENDERKFRETPEERWARMRKWLVRAIKEEVMNFGQVIEKLKQGGRCSRVGWNGKGMWIELQTPDHQSKMTRPYIWMRTVDNGRVPWVASQTDILAEDWETAT